MSARICATIVNFNRRALLLRAIASLQGQTLRPDRILVVDNGSTDGSCAAARELGDPDLACLELDENLGSAGGFHRGLTAGLATGAEMLLLMDSDVVLAPDCLGQLATVLSREPATGVAGPKVYLWEDRAVLQEFGGWIDWAAADLRRSHGRHDEGKAGAVVSNQLVDYLPACCLLTRRSTVEAAGSFDPRWFLYWDDIDWCDRVSGCGLHVQAVAAAEARHFGGGANKRNLVPVYYGWRNRLLFFARRTPLEHREQTMRVFFEDYLLARFTCRTLGLDKTAAVMQRAVDDGVRGIWGRSDLTGMDLSLDAAVAEPARETGVRLVRVHHVIGSATRKLAAKPGAILVDRFGKKLAAGRAWRLRQRFEEERAGDLEALLASVRHEPRP